MKLEEAKNILNKNGFLLEQTKVDTEEIDVRIHRLTRLKAELLKVTNDTIKTLEENKVEVESAKFKMYHSDENTCEVKIYTDKGIFTIEKVIKNYNEKWSVWCSMGGFTDIVQIDPENISKQILEWIEDYGE